MGAGGAAPEYLVLCSSESCTFVGSRRHSSRTTPSLLEHDIGNSATTISRCLGLQFVSASPSQQGPYDIQYEYTSTSPRAPFAKVNTPKPASLQSFTFAIHHPLPRAPASPSQTPTFPHIQLNIPDGQQPLPISSCGSRSSARPLKSKPVRSVLHPVTELGYTTS